MVYARCNKLLRKFYLKFAKISVLYGINNSSPYPIISDNFNHSNFRHE